MLSPDTVVDRACAALRLVPADAPATERAAAVDQAAAILRSGL